MLAVELGLDLAVEDQVGLLEGVVVGLCRTVGLVVDREHRQVVGARSPRSMSIFTEIPE